MRDFGNYRRGRGVRASIRAIALAIVVSLLVASVAPMISIAADEAGGGDQPAATSEPTAPASEPETSETPAASVSPGVANAVDEALTNSGNTQTTTGPEVEDADHTPGPGERYGTSVAVDDLNTDDDNGDPDQSNRDPIVVVGGPGAAFEDEGDPYSICNGYDAGLVTVTSTEDLGDGYYERRTHVIRADDPCAGGEFGYAVAVSDYNIAVSEPLSEAGKVYLYQLMVGECEPCDAGVITPIAGDSDQRFGDSVALDTYFRDGDAPGDASGVLVVGSPGDRDEAGSVTAFVDSVVDWDNYTCEWLFDSDCLMRLTQRITPMVGAGANFGQAVATKGGVIVAGAPGDANGGSVHLFRFDSPGDDFGSWVEDGIFYGTNGYAVGSAPATGSFGSYVATDGNTVVASDPENGKTYVIGRGTNGWEIKATLDGAGSVAVSGRFIVIGDVANDAAHVYYSTAGDPTRWALLRTIGGTAEEAGTAYGSSLAMSGGVLVVGAPNSPTETLSEGGYQALEVGDPAGTAKIVYGSTAGAPAAVPSPTPATGAPGEAATPPPGPVQSEIPEGAISQSPETTDDPTNVYQTAGLPGTYDLVDPAEVESPIEEEESEEAAGSELTSPPAGETDPSVEVATAPLAQVDNSPEKRSEIAKRFKTVIEVSWSTGAIVTSMLLAMILAALIGLPATVINETLEHNVSQVQKLFKGPLAFIGAALAPLNSRGWLKIVSALVISTLLYQFLSPDMPGKGFLIFAAGAIVAFSMIMLVKHLTWKFFLHRDVGDGDGQWNLFPSLIGIGTVFVAISRMISLTPGLMLGGVADFKRDDQLEPRLAGKRVAMTMTAMLILGVTAWFAWAPVDDAAEQASASNLTLIADVAIALFALAAMEMVVWELIPVRFLDGSHMRAFSKAGWAVLWFTGLFFFAHAVLNPAITAATGDPDQTLSLALILAGLTVAAIAIWTFFHTRSRTAPAAG